MSSRRHVRSVAAFRAVATATAFWMVLAAVLAGVASGQQSTMAASPPQHDLALADAGSFDPGSILSDAVLSDSRSLTEAQVQAFIAGRVPGCAFASETTCLRAYDSELPARPASPGGQCAPLEGASHALASRIVFRVARACQINPKVL